MLPTESLVDSLWQKVSKITLDLPWRPARAALDGLWTFVESYFVIAEPFHASDLNTWGPASFHFAALFSPRPGVVKLRLRSPLSGTAIRFTRMPTFVMFLPVLCLLITSTYPILSYFPFSTPPRHEYTLNGTRRCHRNPSMWPSRYRYIPNSTSAGIDSVGYPYPLPLHAFVRV